MRFPPTCAICPIYPVNARTRPATICGTALTIAAMMEGRLAISDTSSLTPAVMIFPVLPAKAFDSAATICGMAETTVVMMSGRF